MIIGKMKSHVGKNNMVGSEEAKREGWRTEEVQDQVHSQIFVEGDKDKWGD